MVVVPSSVTTMVNRSLGRWRTLAEKLPPRARCPAIEMRAPGGPLTETRVGESASHRLT
jgi:hypothetical protein